MLNFQFFADHVRSKASVASFTGASSRFQPAPLVRSAEFEILLPLVPDKFAHVSSPSAGRLRIPKVIALAHGRPSSASSAAGVSQGQDHGERDEADKVGVIMARGAGERVGRVIVALARAPSRGSASPLSSCPRVAPIGAFQRCLYGVFRRASGGTLAEAMPHLPRYYLPSRQDHRRINPSAGLSGCARR